MIENTIGGIIIAVVSMFIGHHLSVWRTRRLEERDGQRIYDWLCANTSDESGWQFRSTRTIASRTNLTEDRVRIMCSIHPLIFLSTGEKEDMWSLSEREPGSVYEKRGMLNI